MFSLQWWQYILYVLLMTHITIIGVTVFLHREQTHKALKLHPVVRHFFRFWMWLTTGMVTKEWVSVHRMHHANVETKCDPHSPQVKGIKTVFWRGTELYRKSATLETLLKYGTGTPDDWLERNLYSRFTWQGTGLMLLINLLLFGLIGVTIWAVQMLWIPIMAAGVVNGFGHYFGYRNFNTLDKSRNIFPLGILIGGEELHNNHHSAAAKAKLSRKWFEFDIGWMYISIMQFLHIAEVR